jgi:hypothetical protein
MEEEKLIVGDAIKVVGGPWLGTNGTFLGCRERLVTMQIKAWTEGVIGKPVLEEVMIWVKRCYIIRIYRQGEEYRGSVDDR